MKINPLLARSIARYKDQSNSQPNSPGCMVDGKIQLCAAACIAYEIVKHNYDENEANSFAEYICKATPQIGKNLILDVFDRYGADWGITRDHCVITMEFNDKTPLSDRPVVVGEFMRKLAA